MATYTITDNFEQYCLPITITKNDLTPVYDYDSQTGTYSTGDTDIQYTVAKTHPNYAVSTMHSGMSWCGTNSNANSYCTLNTTIKKIDTIFIASYYSNWNANDGLRNLKIYNDTGDIYDFKNIYTYANTFGLTGFFEGNTINTSTQVTVLALHIDGMESWNSIKIESYGNSYNQMWVAYHTKSNPKLDLPWLAIPYILKNNNLLYIINKNNYNPSTCLYTPVSSYDFDELSCDGLCDTPDYLNGLRPIDLFEGDIQLIVTDPNSECFVSGIKSSKELVVATGDINKELAQTINSITVESVKTNNGNLKLAVSIDKGKTWKTHDGANWVDLSITIPSTEYSAMTTDEKLQWNNARDIIASEGIDTGTFNSIDFNTLTDDNTAPGYLRFAYVLIRPSCTDDIKTTKLNWDFNAKGNMDLMIPGTEYNISLYEKEARFTSLIDNELVKVNFLI